MKRFLLALALLLAPTVASAQCNGVFAPNTICGTVAGGIPGQVSTSVLTGIPGGINGQLQYNNAGVFGGYTIGPGLQVNSGTLYAQLAVQAAKTANYPIVSGDCNTTIPFGTGATAQITATLPALPSAGFIAGCTIYAKNTNTYAATSHATILSGFPSDLNTRLWAGQVAGVQVNAAATGWITVENPGRWRVPGTVTLHFDKLNGNNANDCLSTTTGACLDAQTAWAIQQYQFDNAGTTPILVGACGQTHTTQLNMGGTPLGTNLVQLSPDGNCSFTWTNSGPCINVSDLAELDLNLTAFGGSGSITFGCNTSNTASTGNILLHNAVVLDLEGTPVWNPAGVNDNFMFCDGPCEYTIANGVTQATAAGGNYVIFMNEGGKGTQSGVISASASGGANGVYSIFGNALLILGTNNGGGWSSIGASRVSGNAVLVSNGVTISGGVSVDAYGVNCASLFSCPAWLPYTPSPSCGTATITSNSARNFTRGKTTNAQVDFTITAIGNCASSNFTFTLPNTANSGGAIVGQDITTGKGIVCRVVAGSTTSNCLRADGTVFLVNDHMVASGVYENQ